MKRSRKPQKRGSRKFEKNNVRDNNRLTDSGALSKADRDADERDRRDYSRSKHNDVAWYAQNAQLLTDYASFPFGVPLGNLLPKEVGLKFQHAVPGLMAYYYVPTIGVATQETDPINIAARNIYSFVRHANSGHSNYDSPDLMLYLVAMDSIYMYHSFLKRILGLVLDYTPYNRYYPEWLLIANGVDPADVRANIADLRGFINTYAVQIGSMCVPNSMSYMARHSWMTEGMYTDSTSAKAQTYMYVPAGYYQFQAVQQDDTAVGSLIRKSFLTPNPTSITTDLKKVSDLIEFGQALLTPIITNEDMNIMSGDILKAFGDAGVVKISGVLDGFMQLPVYSAEVLSQIENLRCGVSITSGGVTQDTTIGGGYLKSTDVYVGEVPAGVTAASFPANSYPALTGYKILNFHHDGVAPGEVMVATRLTPAFTQGTGNALVPYALGSEVVLAALAFSIRENAGTSQAWWIASLPSQMVLNAGATGVLESQAHALACWSQFDWAHSVYPSIVSGSGSTLVTVPCNLPMQDLDNYTIITSENLLNLHKAALLSEFSVPQMGAFSKKI